MTARPKLPKAGFPPDRAAQVLSQDGDFVRALQQEMRPTAQPLEAGGSCGRMRPAPADADTCTLLRAAGARGGGARRHPALSLGCMRAEPGPGPSGSESESLMAGNLS
jgi:hypothetical protein